MTRITGLGASIIDLTGRMRARPYCGVARAQTAERARLVGVTLPRLSCYGGEDAVYLDGCLIVGGRIVRERMP